jgi:hypothetical protein
MGFAMNPWGTGNGTAAAPKRRKKRTSSTKTKRTSSTRKKRTSSTRKKPARLVKGSAAAKAYMAKIRKRRK